MIGDACEHGRQIGFGIDAVEFRRADQRVHRRGAIGARIRPSKKVVLPAERHSAQCELEVLPGTDAAALDGRVKEEEFFQPIPWCSFETGGSSEY